MSSNGFAFTQLSIPQQQQRVQEEYVSLNHVDMEHSLRKDEFKTAKLLQNRPRNRYSDVLANERTLFPPSASGKYINANFIDLSQLGELPHQFVASQAPCEEYIDEWLQVLVEHKIELVMMLTQVKEGGMCKADRYWPTKVGESETFGSAGCVVTLTEQVNGDAEHMVIRTLSVQCPGTEGPHVVRHVQYCGWPDHGVPSQPEAFHHLVRYILESPSTAPVMVHCSAGIGRTGTLIAVYSAIALADQGKLTDSTVLDIVRLIKRSRTGSVQRPEQYLFIYKSIAAFLQQRATSSK